MPTFQPTTTPILSQKSDCLLLFAAAAPNGAAQLSPTAAETDAQLGGQLAALCARGDFTGKSGQLAWLSPPADWRHKRLLLAGLGEDPEDAGDGMTAAFAAIADRTSEGMAHTAVAAAHLPADSLWPLVMAAGAAAYVYKMGGTTPAAEKLRRITLALPQNTTAAALKPAAAAATGAILTRHLAEQPGNVCTPEFLGKCAQALAKSAALHTTVLDEKAIRKHHMGGLLGVAQGSARPPRFIVMEHRGGAADAPPIVLIGKGVTFDTGGISIKPAATMDEMKFDMCGAATVFGVMRAAAAAKLPHNITGIIPACENMPSGTAIKPGDVITAASGTTIEVLNTDAEGRLILADALHYADGLGPATVIDIATLTGACVIALGNHTTGLMGRGDHLMQALQTAGTAAGDPCWRLPLGKKYQAQLKSDYADLANIGGRNAGTLTAACFLSRFTKCPNWAHLDIAGTAWTSKKRATARPVGLLVRYLSTLPAAKKATAKKS